MILKRFDKYVLGEISTPFYLGVTVYSFTMLVNTVFQLSELLISKGAPPLTVIRMMLFIIPTILSLTIPMATLMGVLAGLSRMSSDSEILAFRTLGIHHHRLYKPVFIFSILTWLLSSLLSMYLAPETQFQFTRLQSQVYLSRAVNQINPRSFYTELPSYVLFFEDVDPQTKEWKHVFLYSYKLGESDIAIIADRGRFTYTSESRRSGFITLKNGQMHRFNRQKPQENYEITSFETLIEEVPEYQDMTIHRRSINLPIHKLWQKMKENGQDLRLTIDFHNRFAFPFAALVLGFLGVSLGISTKRGGRTSGFVLSLALIFVYYALMTLGRNLTMSKAISPFWGIWGANIFLMVLGIVIFRLTSHGATIRYDFLKDFWARISIRVNKVIGSRQKPVILARYYPPERHLFRILDFYILRRLTFSFSLVFFSLMAIMYISKVLELIDNILNNNLPFSLVIEYIYHYTPEVISFTLPISVLTAILLTFSLMSKQNEIITIQVSGISLHRIIIPALCFGLALSLGFFALQELVLPKANQRAKELLNTIYGIDKNNNHEDSQKIWAIDKDNRIFFYNYFDTKAQCFSRFNLIEISRDFQIKTRISCVSARWQDDVTLALLDGTERTFNQSTPSPVRSFAIKTIDIPDGRQFFKKINLSDNSTEFMNIAQLRGFVRYLKENQSDPTRYQAKIYQKILYPFSSLVMALIAIPFSFLMGKKGSLHGIGVAVIISMVFMSMIGFLNSIGSNGILPPLLAGLLPYLLFSGIALCLISRIRT